MIVNRRNFFRNLVSESISAVEELKGIPQFRLNEIHKMPDELFRKTVPTPVQDSSYFISESKLLKITPKEKNSSFVRQLAREEMIAVSLFDGRRSIQSIAEEIVRGDDNVDAGTAYSIVRKLFIEFANLRIYVPLDKPEGVAGTEGER